MSYLSLEKCSNINGLRVVLYRQGTKGKNGVKSLKSLDKIKFSGKGHLAPLQGTGAKVGGHCARTRFGVAVF